MDYLRELRALVGHRLLIGPGVRAVIRNAAGDVLMQLRGDCHLWGLPAGGVEPGESAWDALCREVREETGLTVVSARPFGIYSHPRHTVTYPNGDQVQAFAVAFLVEEWTGSLSIDGDETLELRFFPLSAPPPSDRITRAFQTMFHDLQRHLETGDFIVD